MGFYELKAINIPTVPWKSFTRDTALDEGLLWTVRVALEEGNDMNLPRAVGVMADEAFKKGNEFLDLIKDKGIVIYYPYFIAEKSGVLDISNERIIIEACDKDLWNLVTYGRKNVTLVLSNRLGAGSPTKTAEQTEPEEAAETPGGMSQTGYIKSCRDGDASFLTQDEIEELKKYSSIIGGRYREELNEGKSVLAEWSYAYNTDTGHKPEGSRYLIFYELRDV
jgi:hypothetical protein